MSDVPETPRVAVTGIGALSCAGRDAESLWRAALTRQINATWWADSQSPPRIAVCRAADPEPPPAIRPSDFRRLDRFAQLGITAGHEAWNDAGLMGRHVDGRRIAIVCGSSRGSVAMQQASLASNTRRVRPTAAAYSSISSLAGSLAGLLDARGPTMTISATCASSAVALGVAATHIISGLCDVALVGGADAPLQSDLIEEMRAAGLFAEGDDPQRLCRPFDIDRTGVVLGEAGAFLVLESVAHAELRGAHVRAWLTGWSSVCDPGQRSGMSDDYRGVRDALLQAIAHADCDLRNVDGIHTHGTGTLMNDTAEAAVIRELFGARVDELPCTSTKPITGHCLGASGALQAVINVRALEEQRLPPTANCDRRAPACEIAVVRNEPRAGPLTTILTHSAGFWGNHAGLLFERA